jgi:hypothetical protein
VIRRLIAELTARSGMRSSWDREISAVVLLTRGIGFKRARKGP